MTSAPLLLLLSTLQGSSPSVPPAPGAPREVAAVRDGTTVHGGELTNACRNLPGTPAWSYCVTTTAGSRSSTVLYYLHGLNGNAERWVLDADYKTAVRRAWKESGKAAPIVVSVSFGGFWLLVEKNGSAESGLLDVFVDRIMPEIERAVSGGPPAHRLLFGESMGGFNAAQLLLKRPALFERVALACPAIAGVSPYASPRDIAAFVVRTRASPEKALMTLALSRRIFPTPAAWEASSPLTLGEKLLGRGTPPLYVSIGRDDTFGFQEGAERFARLAQSAGVPTTWSSVPGGHCAADAPGIASFLLP